MLVAHRYILAAMISRNEGQCQDVPDCDSSLQGSKERSQYAAMRESYILKDATILLVDGVMEESFIVVENSIIRYISHGNPNEFIAAHPESANFPIESCQGEIIMPELVESHIHGAFGIGFESVKGGEDIARVAERLLQRGVGRFVPTILWDEGAVRRLSRAIDESGLQKGIVEGIYVEGPFVNPQKKGGINIANIAAPDPDLCKRVLDAAGGKLVNMTVAPELPGIDAIYAILEDSGILISLGHSNAKLPASLPGGNYSVTHLFNAMSGVDHREAGLANLALSGQPRWVELNADGIHVNSSSMRIVRSCIPAEKLILTSDAVVSAGLPYGDYLYFGHKVRSDGLGVRYGETGTLIGSSKLGMEIVSSYARASGAALWSAVASMTATPSAALGPRAAARPGKIETGAPARIFIWDENLRSCRRPLEPKAPRFGKVPE